MDTKFGGQILATKFGFVPDWSVFMKNFHGSSDICPMDFIYSIQICEISHQTFGPSHRKCPTCPMIFVNTASVTLTFDLWPWPFARTSLLSLVITPENFMMIQWQEHNEQGKSEGFDSCNRSSNLTQIGFESLIFQPVWPLNLMDDPKNNRAPLLYYIKLCASFQIHQLIQTGVTVRKRPIWVKFNDFF